MKSIRHKPLWVRLCAYTLSLLIFLQNLVYPWISILPAPPPIYAQEASPPEASLSATTPAPSPLDLPLDLDTLFSSTQSADITSPEATPEADLTPIPEATPEASISPSASPSATPTLTPSPSPTITTSSTSPSPSITGTLDNGNTGTQNTIPTVPSTPPPYLDPFFISLNYPFDGNYPISYKFGQISSSNYVQVMQSLFDVDNHDGLDFAMPEGTEIMASSPGKVIHAGSGIYGVTVILQHSWGRSYYGHLSQTLVTVGEDIIGDQIIGLSGNTGITTGPHLHFGIRPNHFDPYNGYHGMIDPLPYLEGKVLGGAFTQKYDLINLPFTTLRMEDLSAPITLLASDSAKLTFELINPLGISKIVYPSFYDYGTGESAILSRPTPFIPGQYTLRTTTSGGSYDEQTFSWGVIALNPDQSIYSLGDRANLAFAVLDGHGEMVCDADLALVITSPTGLTQNISTKTGEIGVNTDTCLSKDLTITPDYQSSFIPTEIGDYTLVLTATTSSSTNTIIDHLTVSANPDFNLKRLSATRIYPAHQYPVIFAITPQVDYQGTFVEQVPAEFTITSLSESEIKDWSQAKDQAKIITSPYTKLDQTKLSWELDLKAGQTYYFGYLYDAPDISPQLYSLGGARLGDWQENRSWSIAVDAVEKTLGFFSPPATWNNAGDINLSLAQPDPRSGDLMVATLAIRPSASTINTPSGWTLLDSQTGTDGGAEGADTGSVGLYTFYKVADGIEGSSTVTFTENGTTSAWEGNISKVRSATGAYSLNSGGYSINADATNWNGTLDTDIGLTQGDIVLLLSAQNGDLSDTSAWNIAATGVTNVSSVNEHGEYATTTGNDLEAALATAQIWGGTNTATPTVTLTRSVAASGAVMAVRIRQGSGTNRTDSWVRSAGPQIAGTTSVSVAYPEHEIGDLLLLFVGSRATADNTPTTPTGWTSLGSYNGGTGTFGIDAGNSRTTIFYKQSNIKNTGTQTVSVTSGNVVIGQTVAVHHDGNVSWNLDSDGGTDTTAGTGWSVAGAGIDLDSANGGDLVLVGSSINTDAYTYATPTLSATGMGIGEVTLTSQFNTASGNDMALTVATARITSGSSTGVVPTYGMTASATAGSAPAGSSMFIKINTTTITTDDNHLGFFTPPATWTAAGNANLALAQPNPQAGDLMLATIAIRPSASTVNTPSGWTLLDNQTGTDGAAEGADTGSVRLYTFYKVAAGSEGTATQTFTENGTTSAWLGYIHKIRSTTGTYDLNSGGYSLNGDATNWNGTLDTDIGLTQGDLVMIIGAQNGDLSAASAWDIAATGISSKSTVVVPDEYTTTTGNDLEIDLATTQIWTGTNTATPTITLTQGTAASGTVMAVRIRQGSGTNRTDAWIRSVGDQASGTTSVTVNYPDHEIGDLLLLLVGSRATADNTPTTPVGWTSLGSYNGGTGTFGADAGNSRTTIFYLQAGMRMTGTTTVSITSASTAVGQMFSFHKDGTDVTWDLDTDGGTDTTAGTAWSVTGSGIDLDSDNGGDLIFVGSSSNTDAYTYTTPTLTASGIGIGELTLESQRITPNGNDMAITNATARVTSGTNSNIAPTYGMTASATAGSAPAGSSMFVRITGVTASISLSGTANGNDTATVKFAINNTLQAQTGTIGSSTWTISGVTPPTSGDIITVWVDSVTDSNETTAVTNWSSGNVTDMVLNTNVLTLGSNQDTSLSLTDLNQYDCSDDEDVMHQAASSHLKVEGDSCAGSTSNSYATEQISLLSGDTLAVGTSETVTTYDLSNAGTITSTGNSTYNVAHNWANTSTFTAATSTVNFTGIDSSTQTISGSTTFNNLTATTTSNSTGRTLRFTAGTTTTVSGTLTFTGSTSKIITLESSTTSNWIINPTTPIISYVSVSYSTNTGNDFCPTYSTDGGNNVGWSFICTPTPYSFQRKTFYDDQNARYWRFSYDGTAIISEYSSNATSWTTSNSLPYTTNDFEVGWASISGTEYAYLAVASNHDILVRRGTLGTTSVTWDGTVSTALNGTSSSDHYSYPVITLDSSNLIWIGARYYNGTTYTYKTTSSRQQNTITHQETVTGTAVANPTSVVSASITGTTNHLYLATVSSKLDRSVTSVTGLGLTWNLVRAQCGGRGQTRTEIWYAIGTPSGSGTVTANFGTAPEEAVIAVSRYSNVDTSNPIGNSIGKNSVGINDTTCTGGTDATTYTVDLTTTQDGSMAFGGVGERQFSHTAGAGYTERADVISTGGSGTSAGVAVQEKAVSTPSTLAFDGTISGAVDYSVVAVELSPSLTTSTISDTISTWAWLNGSEISAGQTNANVYGNLSKLASAGIYAIVTSNTSIQGCVWDNVQLRWEDSSNSTCEAGANVDTVGTATSGITTNTSTLSDASYNVHLTYIDSSGHTVYRERTTSWQTAVTLDSNAGNAYPTISYNTSNNDLYAFWIRGDDIYYKKGVSTYASGNWDASATAWKTTGTNTYVTSNYSGSDKIFAEWYDGSALAWDKLSIGASNTAPNSPSSLLQKTTGDVTLSTGVWHNSTSVKFSATASDTDNPDTLYLCVEADLLGVSFSNTEDSCGTGVSYIGSGITVTHTLTLTDAQEYHWQARVKDTAGAYSSWVSYDVNAESARDVGIDTTAPTGGTVYDGTGAGVDITFATNSLSSLSANWSGISSNVSGLLRYDYSIGTSAGATDIKAWTNNSTTTSVTTTGLTLQTSQMYYFNVRAVDNAGNTQTAISSNGQLVSPSISFAITPATATFSNLSAGNSYTDTDVTTLTTSTNAYNGYIIRAFVTDYLRSTTGGTTIGDFSGGTYASPATWVGAETGFGYTSSDTTIGGSNKFGTGTLFAPFSQTGPGDIVADHTSTVTGTAISNESFDITYKVKVASSQPAKSYNAAIIYTATAQY